MLLVGFIGICVWAYSPRQKKDFEEASLLPFENSGDDLNGDELNGDELNNKTSGKKETSNLKSESSLNE